LESEDPITQQLCDIFSGALANCSTNQSNYRGKARDTRKQA
jgi:hypothetical protein